MLTALFVLMAISFVFTYLIVVRPVDFFTNQKQNNNVATTQDTGVQVRATYTTEDVFRPTRMVLTNKNKFEMTSSASIMKEVNAHLNKQFTNLTRLEVMDETSYENLVLREARIQILFDGLHSFGIVNRFFDGNMDDLNNDRFSRIVIRTDDPSTAYFINDDTKQLYSAKVNESFKTSLEGLYADSDFYEVESYRGKTKQFFVEQDNLNVEQSAYLIEQIPMSFYITQLFTNQSEIRTRGDGKTVVYNDNLSQLKLDRTTNVVTFFENRSGEETLLYTNNLTQTFGQMKRLGGWQMGVSLFSVDLNNNLVEYVRYVDSYPILSSGKEGFTQIKVNSTGIEKMRTSSLIAQTPLPTKSKKVMVVGGKTIVTELLNEGFVMNEIEDIRIGYSWTISSESVQIVEFTPTWYIKKNGTWKTLAELKQREVTQMDFKRSAVVLIVCFFILDLFLFGLVWQKRTDTKNPLNTSINVIDQMKLDGITLPTLNATVEAVPIVQVTPESTDGKLSSLPNQVVTLEKNIINGQFVTPIQLDLSGSVSADSFADLTKIVENNQVAFGDQYTWSSYNPTTRKVIYTQKADKLTIMDGSSQIIFTINANDQVVSYEQTYAGSVQVLGKERELITAQRAVEVLYLAGRISSKATVQSVKLSYYQSLVLKDFSIYSPAWYIEIRQADGQLIARRVDAIHGTVLANETLETTNTQTQRTTTNNTTTTQSVQQQ